MWNLEIEKTWVEIECPNCNYQDTIQLLDAKTERRVFCHNCKCSIQLQDSNASVHSGIESIEDAMKDLNNTFKNFGK
jgi:Zn ribbon nucleic-acid-binding protein